MAYPLPFELAAQKKMYAIASNPPPPPPPVPGEVALGSSTTGRHMPYRLASTGGGRAPCSQCGPLSWG